MLIISLRLQVYQVASRYNGAANGRPDQIHRQHGLPQGLWKVWAQTPGNGRQLDLAQRVAPWPRSGTNAISGHACQLEHTLRNYGMSNTKIGPYTPTFVSLGGVERNFDRRESMCRLVFLHRASSNLAWRYTLLDSV